MIIKGDYIEQLENFIFQRMSDSGIVGLSVAAFTGKEPWYRRGFGFRDFTVGTSVTTDTTFCIGSVTKSFTALAILQLQERGLLSVEDSVDKYLQFKAKPMGETVRIRHLLSHSSGLAHLGYAEATLSAITDNVDQWFPICSPDDLLVFMNGAEDWAIAKPGERYAYLNEGYILLGKIIEKVSGVSYSDYIEEQILIPLGMGRSTFHEEDVKNDDDVATPYVTGQNGTKVATRYPYGQMIADGGLMSNGSDMTKFLRMLVSEGELDGCRIVNPESLLAMMKPRIRTVEEPIDGASYRYYGYGLRIKQGFLGETLIQHSGSVFGSSAYICLIPEKQMGIALLANGGYFLEDIGEYMMALMLGRDPIEISYFKRGQALSNLTGTYKTFRNTSSYKVTRSGGILQLETSFGTRTYTQPLIPVDLEGEPKRFRIYGVDTTTPVEFQRRDSELYLVYERNLAKRVIAP
jgi:CubicO group peptidase (beta-lactamase class C family)